MILYINCCVRPESRTHRLALALLEKLGGEYTELRLETEGLQPLTGETLARRTALLEAGDYTDPMFRYAHQFAQADTIVIAAPFWDGSFPASFKVYMENIYVTGLVSRYGPDGMPVGLCRAKDLYYVTTAGGPYFPAFSYGYVEEIATKAFGIEKAHLLSAEMLDVEGFDPEEILKKAMDSIDSIL